MIRLLLVLLLAALPSRRPGRGRRSSGRFVVGFYNSGRPGRPGPVEESLTRIAALLDSRGLPWVLNLVEIMEGDHGYDERRLLRRAFGLRRTGTPRRSGNWEYRNLTVAGGHARVVSARSFAGSPGIAHQSPPRRPNLSVVELPTGWRVGAWSLHYPAGARNGKRPPAVKRALVAAWDRVAARFRKLLRRLHGRIDQVYGIDANHRGFPPQHGDEVELVRHVPDYLRALPVDDHDLVVHDTGWERMASEPSLHGLLWAVIEFKDRTPR